MSLPRHPRLLQEPSLPHLPSSPDPDPPTSDILIDDSHLSLLPHEKDTYRWAILYENQRGITLFSTPFYSPLSLLPSDPHPFTIPNTPSSRRNLPILSLDNYPLPDGTWRWVSTAWMIDMRSDLGEVQHDGFEYNWLFRDNHWHADVGKLGAGAWVRRRRWIRLMMRPAIRAHSSHSTVLSSPSPSVPSLVAPPSRLSSLDLDLHTSYVWTGGDQDWQHVHRLLKQLGRDGRKLELWKVWLVPYTSTPTSDPNAKGKRPDVPLLSSQKALGDILPDGTPPLVHLITLLADYGEYILRSFVFPDSRAQFVRLVRQAGLAEDLERCLGRDYSAADVDFWSYADK